MWRDVMSCIRVLMLAMHVFMYAWMCVCVQLFNACRYVCNVMFAQINVRLRACM